MKKSDKVNLFVSFGAWALVAFALLLIVAALSGSSLKNDNDLARVAVRDGVCLFIDSAPVNDYEIIGREKVSGVVMSVQYEAIRDLLIKKSLKNYPDAEGIIFNFPDECTVIKFYPK